MSQSIKPQIPLGWPAAATAVFGVAAGFLLGCVLALHEANHWLEYYSRIAAARHHAALDEARSVLHAMQGSPYGLCSPPAIAAFRALVFRSEYVKDAGQIQKGMLVCSAISDRPAHAIDPFKSEFRDQDDTFAYSSLSPVQGSALSREALRLGTAYVVFGLEQPAEPPPNPMQLALSLNAGDGPVPNLTAGEVANGKVRSHPAESSGLMNDTLYATRCLQGDFTCMTASTTVPQAIESQPGLIASFAVMGGLASLLVWMGISLLYHYRREFSQQLRRAVARDELKVLYQPIVDIRTREIVGAEALARWNDRDGNAVDPEVFVKTAEDLGFIGSLTKNVLQHILRDLGPTLRSRAGFRVSINLAAADLVDRLFLPMLAESLGRARVLPESLVLEITERSAANSDAAMDTIRDLRRMGHRIHIDDFGSGYSNLDKLLYLYADTIKVDKAFTKVIGSESVAVAILPQIISIAKSLNLEVVVEGVETTYQADYFSPGKQRIYAQGWLYGRPMTVESLLQELAGNRILAQEAVEGYGFGTRQDSLQVIS